MATILIVDDDITTQLILQHALEEQGHTVYTADNGKMAIDLAEKFYPNLMICDWMMPEMDGLDVCKSIKSNPRLTSVFFILLTAKENMKDRIQGLDTGADDFISKPIEIDELLARVRSGLRINNLNQEVLKTNQRLKQALSNLKRAQAQLIQNERMGSLYQFVAGIAHEINNPVTFIRGNLDHVYHYSHDLLDLVKMYQQVYPQPPSEINRKIEEIELDFLEDDFPHVLDSMQQGTERIKMIIQSLRNFSRLDESEQKLADIHEGLDNTLLLLQNRFKEKTKRPIQVIKYYGNLPKILCYPGQLNQVFMNLLNNAVDALAKQQQDHPSFEPKILIKTEIISHVDVNGVPIPQIRLVIKDNGVGISKAIRHKIFDPFFTTKPVGSGTGLGLSIAYEIIVEKHGGTINVCSELGKGSEFIIEIPVKT